MTYDLVDLKGQQAFEVYCVFKREIILQLNKSNNNYIDFSNYTEKDLYKLLSCVKDKNNIPFYENRIKTLKVEKIKELLEFVFDNLKFDLEYKAKLVEISIEFADIKSVLLFYTLQRLTIYYYDYLTNREIDFINWLKNFKTDVKNCQSLIVDSCLTDKDFKLLKSFLNSDTENKYYTQIIDELSSVIYYFLNQDVFFINEIEKMKDFTCDLVIKENLSIQNILATITQGE